MEEIHTTLPICFYQIASTTCNKEKEEHLLFFSSTHAIVIIVTVNQDKLWELVINMA